jgi:hypothetical protein
MVLVHAVGVRVPGGQQLNSLVAQLVRAHDC